jgi:hypothetical protein
MRTGPSVLVPDLGKLILWKPRSEFHQRWPQPAVDIRDLIVDQFADQYVGAVTNSLGHPEYLVAFRMHPPATSDRPASDLFRKARNRPSRRLEHDAVTLDKCHSLFGVHINITPAMLTRQVSAERGCRKTRFQFDMMTIMPQA